jgi:membrane protease subunit (stomatin/prohibitin family)
MKQTGKGISRRRLLGGLALLVCTQPAWAIFGVWRRAARRTVIVAGAATTAAVASESAAASQEAAAAASAQAAANASAMSAQQAAAAADQAAANASQTKTPQQRLKELQSLYDQGLISASDYEAAKKKILNQLTQ